MSKLSDLTKIPLLSRLSESERETLCDVLIERTAPKSSYIVYKDDPARSLFFILSGEVKINLVSPEGKEIVLAYLGEGEFFGELAILTGEDRSANVVATSECKLLVLSEADFKSKVLSVPGFSLAMMASLAERLTDATEKIGDLALFDVYRRVARTLKSLGEKQERDGSVVYIISERPTHQELASVVGTSREMVTRALKGLEEDGCILVEGKQIELVKLPR